MSSGQDRPDRKAKPEVPRHAAAAESATGANGTVPKSIAVVVVDEHRFHRQMMSARLTGQGGRYHVVAEKGDAKGAIEACAELLPDLMIVDINLPDRSGIDAMPKLSELCPNTRVLLCTSFVSDDRILEALRSGAHGFVEKTNSWEDFLEAVERVSAGERFFRSQSCPALTAIALAADNAKYASPAAALSSREKEILTLIAQGHSTKEIAGELFISIGTVESHRTNLMGKLKTRNVAGLVVYAFRAGLIR